jgi:heat shock protein HslJ
VRVVLALAVLVVLAVSACGEDEGGTVDAEAIEGSDWQLDASASTPEIGGEVASTFALRDGQASGTLQCNTYTVTMELAADGTVELGEMASTAMACFPDSAGEAEDAFSAALQSVTRAAIDGDGHLVLTGPDDVSLVFTAIDEAELLVQAWDVIQVARDDAIQSVVEGTSPVLTFADDGTLTLTTGCNDLGSSWTLDGRFITIDPPRSTMMACAEPEGVMEQEAALGAALEAAHSVQVSNERITLLDEQDHILLGGTPKG